MSRISVRTHNTEIGAGHVLTAADETRLTVPAVNKSSYHDAQITDYTLADRDFAWGPGTRLSVTAQFNTGNVRGTAGFGFWNHPFSPEMRGLPRLPQAAWFFYGSPPHNIPLAKGVPGAGWKAATINATRWQFLALAPLALPGFLLMRVPALYNALWPIGQDAIGVRECLLPPAMMTERHTYTIDWRESEIVFGVDGDTVMVSLFRQRGRMGVIAWVDNQYAVVTPQGNFGWGLLDVPGEQSLSIFEIACGN